MPILTQVALSIFATAIKKIQFCHKQRDILADEEGEEAMFSSFALGEFIIRFAKRRLKITNPEANATSEELGKLKKNSIYFAKKTLLSLPFSLPLLLPLPYLLSLLLSLSLMI